MKLHRFFGALGSGGHPTSVNPLIASARTATSPLCGCTMNAIMDSLLIQARKASRDPRDCRNRIDRLRSMGFDDEAFKRLHHQGGSLTRIYSYSMGVQQFEEDGNNHRVHQRLLYVLLSCTDGMLPKEKSFLALAEEARKEIPPIE